MILIMLSIIMLILFLINSNTHKDEKILIGPILFLVGPLSTNGPKVIVGIMLWYLFDIIYNIYIFIKECK